MAVITISGEPGCRSDDVARSAAHQLKFELIHSVKIARLLQEGFGDVEISDKAYPFALASVLAGLATSHHLVVTTDVVPPLLRKAPGSLAIHVFASEARRIGTFIVERRLDRPAARQLLRDLEKEKKDERKRRTGRSTVRMDDFDIVLNAASLEPEQMGAAICAIAKEWHVEDLGFLSPAAEAQFQFQIRLQLSKFGITPAGKVQLKRAAFVHPSEEIFANLLDFYGISWEYEPRSFPIQWDKQGRVLEAFTPDFYLPEVDLYVELTTMKQALVTKKNRKIKLLKTIYPDVNIQVFYQKDIQNLIFKYGLVDRAMPI